VAAHQEEEVLFWEDTGLWGGRNIASQTPASLQTWHPWFCWSLGAILIEAKHCQLAGLHFWCQCMIVHGHGAERSHIFSC